MLRITFTESRNNAKYISIESIKKDEYRRNNQHITTKSIRVDRVIKKLRLSHTLFFDKNNRFFVIGW